MNLQSEVNQKEKNKYCIIAYIYVYIYRKTVLIHMCFGAHVFHELLALLTCLEFILAECLRVGECDVEIMLATFHFESAD